MYVESPFSTFPICSQKTANIPPLFDPPEGQPPYDYVFDLTGEVRQDRTDMVRSFPCSWPFGLTTFQIQISTTCNVARILGEEAAKRKVKAYVRLQLPFYETSNKGPWDEKQNPKPSGTVGTWWHETLRILANMEECVFGQALCLGSPQLLFSLNLVILRVALGYGPYTDYGTSE